MTTSTDSAKKPVCSGCGARNYDRGRFHAVYGLCTYCFVEPASRQQAADRWRANQPAASREDDWPTDAPPGSQAKVSRLAHRLANHLELFHPEDATLETAYREPVSEFAEDDDDLDCLVPPPEAFQPRDRQWQKEPPKGRKQCLVAQGVGKLPTPTNLQEYANLVPECHKPNKAPTPEKHVVRPAPDPQQASERVIGVELDNSRQVTRWRARPRYRGCRVECGTYETPAEAAAAVAAFHAEPKELRPIGQGRRNRSAAAVVRLTLTASWLALDWPPGASRRAAYQAARLLQTEYRTRADAEADYTRLVSQFAG